MQFYKVLSIVLLLGIGKSYAQDSTIRTSERIKENLSPVVALRDGFFTSPALKLYQRKHSYSILAADYFKSEQDLYLQQKGKGKSGIQIYSESYQKISDKDVLWGNAYYRNEKSNKVNFNETADYQKIYPYVMADTIGGDLPSETYYVAGGYSSRFKKIKYGFSGSFRGVQAFRDVDPRPLNITSDVQLQLSAGLPINKVYAVSIDMKGSRYSQKNELKFANELGTPIIYHMAGLGVYNEFLAGTRASANFNGTVFGFRGNLVPGSENGFLAQLGYEQYQFDKIVNDITFAVAEAKEDQLEGTLGYTSDEDNTSYAIKVHAVYSKRTGTEPKFSNRDSGVGIDKISEDIRFISEKSTLSLEAIYGRKSERLDWFVAGELSYISSTQQYISPNRYLDYTNLIMGLNVTATKKVNSTFLSAKIKVSMLQNLSGAYDWNDLNVNRGMFNMLTGNYTYLTAQDLNFSAILRADLPVSDKLNLFIKADGGHTSYQKSLRGTQLMLSAGFIF